MNETLKQIEIAGYRSVHDLRLDLGNVTIVRGANGVGKTNLYRALEVLALSSQQNFLRTAALEGGVDSMRWAGPKKRKGSMRMRFCAQWTDLSVQLQLGFPSPTGEPVNAFTRDPEIKEEIIWPSHATPRSWLYKRVGALVSSRTDDDPLELPNWIQPWEVGLAEIGDPALFPEVEVVRRRLASWRFYHQFRTDPDSPLRRPSIGFRSPVLSSDGANLPAALQTILQIGDEAALARAVERVFRGRLSIDYGRPEFELTLTVPDMVRPLTAMELSDGQLRFLCLTAALLSPRPPELFVLNEPETSLHDETIVALAELISTASANSQVIVTTHSNHLVRELEQRVPLDVCELVRVEGATVLEGASPFA